MFYSAIKSLYGPRKPSTTQFLSAEGVTLIKDRKGINKRWREHISSLLSRLSTVSDAALDSISQQPIKEALDRPPTLAEVKRAIFLNRMSAGKVQGKDGIPAEIYKTAGPTMFEAFHDTITSVWEDKGIHRFSTVPLLFLSTRTRKTKQTGDLRRISLLSIAGKIIAVIILNRLITGVSKKQTSQRHNVAFVLGRAQQT